MNSNNQNTQDYSNLPMDNNDGQHTSIVPNTAPQTFMFEFYFPLPNDTRIYHVTYQYTELHPLENARLLNNRINLSHILDNQFPLHNNIHSLIQQQIQHQVQQPIYQQSTENNIQQQFFDTIQPNTTQVYPNNNTHDTTSISVNGTIFDNDNIQHEEFQNSPRI
ncbi:hypothetical protein C1646_751862 [Rhizophagus diaphanus]|nr:hypothetical protein C1646_751862 [Rhizophagus diaphanus] [Rhizophagus sp. MUCL 43196]